MTLSDERKPALAELSARAETTSQKESQPERPAAPPPWLQDLESQRHGMFDALLTVIEDDKLQCDAIIKQAQSNPKELFVQCVGSREEATCGHFIC